MRGDKGRIIVAEWVCHGLTHLPGIVVLDQSVQRHHPVDLQQNRCRAELLLARASAQMASGRAAAFLLTVNLHA